MKNITRLLVATFALVSAGSMANLAQPSAPVGEDAPFRVSAGANTNFKGVRKTGSETGMGFGNLVGAVGFAHNLGGGLEYGASIAAGWSSYEHGVWRTEAKDSSGARMDIELMTRFMPEMSEGFHFGGLLEIGYGRQFNAEAINDNVSFGDLSLRVGPTMSYNITDSVVFYSTAAYTLSAVRFGAKTDAIKKMSNLSGASLPLGMWFAVAETAGVFVEAAPELSDFSQAKRSFGVQGNLGVTFAI